MQKFGGATYQPERDAERLTTALERVYALMSDGEPRSLATISTACGCSEAGASARLRDLRKPKFKEQFPSGGIDSMRIEGGLWMYRMLAVENGGKQQKELF